MTHDTEKRHPRDDETVENEPTPVPGTENPHFGEIDAEPDAVTERARLQDQLRRAMADLQNFRRRNLKEIEEARRRATESLILEMLPVLDNFKLALAAHDVDREPSTDDAMAEGVRMVQALMVDVLGRHGVKEIDALGTAFDPNMHEAVGVDPDSDRDEGTVSRVVQPGYTMEGRVIRPAKVMVAGDTQQSEATAGDEEAR